MSVLTPLRRQYLEIKKEHPDCLLLFRIGDFYETFDADASVLARELDIVLTTKTMGRAGRIPLAGVPHHSLERHLATLIARGYRVAICEQLTEAGNGLIERGVTRIITPGTILEPGLLDRKINNYLAAVTISDKRAGLAYADVSTGEFAATELPVAHLGIELQRLAAAEVLTAPALYLHEALRDVRGVTTVAEDDFKLTTACETLHKHFETQKLAAFGLRDKPLATAAAAAILAYLKRTREDAAQNLTRLNVYDAGAFMILDAQTLRSLDVFESSLTQLSHRPHRRHFKSKSKTHQAPAPHAASPTTETTVNRIDDYQKEDDVTTLIGAIDFTTTAMGGRLLRRLLRRPTLDKSEIFKRQECVAWFVAHTRERATLRELLTRVQDIERLASRVRSQLATAFEMWTLGKSLKVIPQVREVLRSDSSVFASLLTALPDCADTAALIEKAIDDDLTLRATSGVIRQGYSPELDALRAVMRDGEKTLADMEARERARTGIKSLRLNFNKVFGYYIEITKPNLHLTPSDYTRKQTLVNAERFVTLELKEYEALVTNAQQREAELEKSLFRHLCLEVGGEQGKLTGAAQTLAFVDCMIGLAEAAVKFNYTRPHITDGDELELRDARHPVLEQRLPQGEFIGNDVQLGGTQAARIMLLTGPNMSGKSTFMRAVALNVLLAHTGSFVPSAQAVIGICDRIWTRTGLYDRIGAGESTFMTEMIETAEILHGASSRSLVLLDELGRGTSTFDGLAVARAVVEYIHNHPRLKMKTLFATHYHELTDLEEVLPHVRNFHVAIREYADDIEFLYKVEPGRAEKSYGIHAARLAGLPRPVVRRAQELLNRLEGDANGNVAPMVAPSMLRNSPDELRRALDAIHLDDLSPIEALTKLYELQAMREQEADVKANRKRA